MSNDSSGNSTQILNDIKKLQKMETDMFSNLDTNPNLTEDEKNQMVDEITNIANMRVNLYHSMGGINAFMNKAFNSTLGTLDDQSYALAIIEKELKESRRKLEIMQQEKMNKIRQVEINEYYSDKYKTHTYLMQVIVLTLIPIIILTLLYSRGTLKDTPYYILLILVLVVGGYFSLTIWLSITKRNNMNYDTYDFYFDASNAPSPSTDASNNSDPWTSSSSNSNECSGADCCDTDMSYDSSNNICVESFGGMNITESMIDAMVNNSTNQNKYKQNNNSNFVANNSPSFINYASK
jgi:hypothetical protein